MHMWCHKAHVALSCVRQPDGRHASKKAVAAAADTATAACPVLLHIERHHFIVQELYNSAKRVVLHVTVTECLAASKCS